MQEGIRIKMNMAQTRLQAREMIHEEIRLVVINAD